MYKLGRQTPAVEAVWEALPPQASEELTLALADVCEDPYSTTESRDSNNDRDPERILTLQHTAVALLVFEGPTGVRRVRIKAIEYLG